MGTNYYLKKEDDWYASRIHIGKSSCGNIFLFFSIGERLKTYEDYKTYLKYMIRKKYIILDEYDRALSLKEFKEIVKYSKDNFIDNGIDETPFYGWVDPNGYRFTTCEFS